MPEQLGRLREGLAGRYEIEREIGRGGMATVYRARDIHHDRPVALKVLHAELAESLGAERFQREIRVAASLQHPHILTVHDSGTTGGYLWFTMPFVEGESLRERISRERQLPIADAVRITREVALALDYAHRRGIVHRDIKPENILLIDGQAIVADFGIARALGGSNESLTSTGMIVGTPGYMSPEQAAGDKAIDARTDVYSLGSVLYEMLAGEPPFTAATAQAVIARLMTESARPLPAVRSTVSRQLAGAVDQAMAKSPADRPATAGDFARLLESTATMPAAAPIASPRRLSWWAAVGAAVAIVGVVGGALGVLWSRTHAASTGERKIAVLPFENAGGADDEYFADGMTDEVRSRLSTIHGIRVTARASSAQYRRSKKLPREIGRELEVQYLLTGTVRWSKTNGVNRVRVTPELIEVANADTRWSQPYDTVLSDVFAVQASIASKVAEALNVALAPPVEAQLAVRPTSNLDAYDEFLKGEKITSSLANTNPPTLLKGLEHYEQAARLDSTFARAWSAIARGSSIVGGTAPTKELVERARVAAERTLQLAPGRPEARLAMGDYLRSIKLDYEGARQQYLQGLELDANNADLLGSLAIIERIVGKFDDALVHAKQAAALDPRSVTAARRLAGAYHDLRRFADEQLAWDRALALAPDNLGLIQGKAIGLLSLGQLDSVHALVHTKLAIVDTTALLVRFSLFQEMMWVLPRELWPKILPLTVADFANDKGHWGLKIGHTYLLLGDTVRGRTFGDTARLVFEAQLREFPDRAQLHELLGRALALGGHRAEAIAEAERSLALRETMLDVSLRPYVHFQVARILVQSGEYDKALDLIEPLLTMKGSDVTPAVLKLDPTFKPLVGNPRFQRLLR
ncbi:MAG TPA: protein kinase [Gemmatimonadaceae bacterium]|nr:protein kinase [Gemmatimonadaceae bacterium]